MANSRVVFDPQRAFQSGPKQIRKIARWWVFGVAIALTVLLAVGVHFANAHWPYRYRIVKPMLEDVLGSQLTITRYHRTYFPYPGFIAEGLTLRRKSAPDLPPLGSVQTLFVQGRWSDLLMLRERVHLVDITSLHIVVPAIGSRANHEDFPPGSASDFAGPDTMIDELRVHNGLLDIMRENGQRYSFPISELDIRNFQKGRANAYQVDLQNAKPWGRIHSTGSFGPLNAGNLGTTPVSGIFSFSSVRLSDIGNLHGTLKSTGYFKGPLAAIETSANAVTPDFAVDRGRPTTVSGTILGRVNGLTGEVLIHQVEVRSGATTIAGQGGIVGAPKTTNLDIALTNGRAQDVLRPFLQNNVPITGAVWLHGHAYVGPMQKGAGFLERLRVDGVFDVPAERATNENVEKNLTDFSHRAEGKPSQPSGDDEPSDPNTDVLSELRGAAQIRDGIASTQHLIFQIVGAKATLNGTFNFHDQSVHLTGNLATHADISHDVTGFKSVLLKPLAPFLKKHNAGAVIPIAVTGAPGRYQVTQDFFDRK
jgi:hypothetical protein